MMSAAQRDYVGALLQGVVGLDRGLAAPDTSAAKKSSRKATLSSSKTLDAGRDTIKLWTGTWNMGGKAPPDFAPSAKGMSPSVRPWLNLDEGLEHDIYVVGVQEMDQSVFELVETQLDTEEFIPVAKATMGAIGLAVYIRKSMIASIKRVETVHEATGFAGVGTNKGFVAASFVYQEQPFLFINCHLAARDDSGRLKQRLAQIRLCVKRLRLGRLANADVLSQFSTFWIGDMNFRVCVVDRDAWPESGRGRAEWKKALYDDDSAEIQRAQEDGDQLALEIAKGSVLYDFVEKSINFPPSYKYVHFGRNVFWESVRPEGSQTVIGHVAKSEPSTEFSEAAAMRDLGKSFQDTGYYLSLSAKQRREYTDHKEQSPSWTDRILTKALYPVQLKQLTYESVDSITTSDHSPVCSSFDVVVPRTMTSIPRAAFHVGSIQFLRIEVVALGKDLESGYEQNGGGNDSEDDDGERLGSKAKKEKPPAHYDELSVVAAYPCLRETSNKYRFVSKPAKALTETHTYRYGQTFQTDDDTLEFRWLGKELANLAVGPFLTTREYLKQQTIVLQLVQPGASSTPVAHCTITLKDASYGTTANFEGVLTNKSQPCGLIRGRVRVWLDEEGWDSEYAADPTAHPLYPKTLAANYNAYAHPRRKKSATPPSNVPDVPPTLRTGSKRRSLDSPLRPALVQVVMGDDEADGEEASEDPKRADIVKQTIANTLANASGAVNARRGPPPLLKTGPSASKRHVKL